MRTRDNQYISKHTLMCDSHARTAMAVLVMHLDNPYEDASPELVIELRQALASERAHCVKHCGRVES